MGMEKRIGVPVVVVLSAVLALTGCGGDDDGGGSGGSGGAGDSGSSDSGDSGDADGSGSDEAFDTCSLLETEDLEAAFGGPWEPGELTHLEETGADQCIWGNADPPPIKQFSIVVYRDGHLSQMFQDGGVTLESLYEDTKELMPDVEELDLGDDSYRSGSTIYVLDGDTSYEFSTVLGTSPEALAGLQQLAERVAG